jgi:hypothetical protein
MHAFCLDLLPQNTDHNALVMFRIPLFPSQFREMANPGGIQARSRALPGIPWRSTVYARIANDLEPYERRR